MSLSPIQLNLFRWRFSWQGIDILLPLVPFPITGIDYITLFPTSYLQAKLCVPA